MRHGMDPRSLINTPEVGDKTKVFHKGHVIYREGQSSNEAYIIKQGSVSLYRVAANKRINLGTLRHSQIFGEMGVITEEKRSATAEALEYTEVIVLDQNLLHTLLLKSPRPVQIITSYLVERVRMLNSRVGERPTSNTFASVCNILLLCHKATPAKPRQAGAKAAQVMLSSVEVSKTIKDILLISQLEIDDILEKLSRLHVIECSDVKGSFYRKDPLLGTMKKTTDFVKERLLTIPDTDRFAQVTKNLAKEPAQQDPMGSDLEFFDLNDFAQAVDAPSDIILKKIAYGEIPPTIFFFHKSSSLAFANAKGQDFFQRAKRPRLRLEDIQTVDDIVGLDNPTIEEALSRLGFYKVAVLTALAGEEARNKMFKNLSKKIAAVVKEEAERLEGLDPDEASDVEDEFLALVKSMKGLPG